MANTPVVVLDDTMTNIANAIRSKTGGSATMTPGQMPAQIMSIPSSGGGIGVPREISVNGVFQMPSGSFAFSLPSTVTDVGAHVLQYAFYDCASLTSVNFSSLTTVSGNNAFSNAFFRCTGLTSLSFPSLTTVSSNYAFSNACFGCTFALVDFSSLVTVSGINAFGSAFQSCNNLTSVNFSSLTTVSGSSAFSSAFKDCTGLTSLSFPALTTSSFGSNTNQFDGMLSGVTGCTVHFPAAIQSTIGNWASVQNGFGGTNTTVLFDL